MEPQRIYLIGTGIIASAHSGVIGRINRPVELHAADPKESARNAFAEKHPEATLYSSSEEMLASPARKDDIVVNVTPPFLHHAESLKALKSGRHVLCEKPFALNLEQATDMVETAEKLGLTIGCCSRRYSGWEGHLTACEFLRENRLGRLFRAEWIDRDPRLRRGLDGRSRGVLWSLDKSKAGGGRLMDLGPYDVSIWMDLFEPQKITISDAVVEKLNIPTEVPDGITYDVETHVSATITFQRKDDSSFFLNYERSDASHAPESHQRFVHGVDGSMTWDTLSYSDRSLHHYFSKDDGEPTCTTHEYPAPVAPDCYDNEPLPQFAKYLAGDPNNHALTGRKALQYFSVIAAIYQAAEEQRSVSITL